jgi:hypothetical protein
MKTKYLMLLFFIVLFGNCVVKAQTASQYFLHICKGNYLKYYASSNGSGWEARTTIKSIDRKDSINGKQYFIYKGVEIPNYNTSDTSTFQVLWLRQDYDGNILIGAYDNTNTSNLDSAMIFEPAQLFFSNQFLTLGYSRSYSFQSGVIETDSVVSITATAGTYTNCIQSRYTRKVNNLIDMMEDTYYAKNVGEVKTERFFPANSIHINNIVQFVNVNCYSSVIDDGINKDILFNIYPNPSSEKITIDLSNYADHQIDLFVFNALGQQVITKNIINNSSNIILDVSQLKEGIYYFRAVTDMQKVYDKKIIINK